MGKMAFTGLAILFPVTIMVTKTKAFNSNFGFAAIVISLLMLFGLFYGVIPSVINLGFENFVLLIFISSVICLLGYRRGDPKKYKIN